MSQIPPRFSIVLPAYQAHDTLALAIESVLAQEFADWELIIVDDGSTDDTGAIARAYADGDARIKVFSQPNAGCAGARRAAASRAQGDFVTKLDADDAFTPDALTVLAQAVDEHPDYDIYSANGVKVYPEGRRVPALSDPRFFRPCSLKLEDIIDDCWIFGGGATIRRETLERIGGFREEYYCEDYDLWIRALAQGARHLYVPATIYEYRMSGEGRMNADPVPSFHSYLDILADAEERGLFSPEQSVLAKRSSEKFRARIDQLRATGTTDATYTERQAQAFTSRVQRAFGPRLGRAVILLADKLKWIVKPLRVALARRARERDAR